MGVFKNIKSLFIIEDEEENQKSSVSSKKEKTPPSSISSTPSEIKESSSGKPGTISNKFMNILLAAMEKNNVDGFDYLEYKQSLKSLKKMSMDEPTRYKSAFAMAQTMGASPERLVETANHYIEVLKTEEEKFESALSNQKEKHIQAKEIKLTKLEKVIAEKLDHIKKLEAEIKNHQNDIIALKDELQSAHQKMASTKNNFIASYNALVSQIDQDIDNIKNFLK